MYIRILVLYKLSLRNKRAYMYKRTILVVINTRALKIALPKGYISTYYLYP